MEQVPNIAMFLHESRPNFPAAFSRYLVPIVVRYLTDPNNQVSFRYRFCIDQCAKKSFLFESCFLTLLFFTGAEDKPGSASCIVGTGPPL